MENSSFEAIMNVTILLLLGMTNNEPNYSPNYYKKTQLTFRWEWSSILKFNFVPIARDSTRFLILKNKLFEKLVCSWGTKLDMNFWRVHVVLLEKYLFLHAEWINEICKLGNKGKWWSFFGPLSRVWLLRCHWIEIVFCSSRKEILDRKVSRRSHDLMGC